MLLPPLPLELRFGYFVVVDSALLSVCVSSRESGTA
jgi:hypothetical protein